MKVVTQKDKSGRKFKSYQVAAGAGDYIYVDKALADLSGNAAAFCRAEVEAFKSDRESV